MESADEDLGALESREDATDFVRAEPSQASRG
jgi:hypothetical protein